jgi:hypothetical protein
VAKEKKLTIKHVFGKDLDKISPGSKNLFPVYVTVTYNRKTTKFKSPSLNLINQLFEVNPGNYNLDFSMLSSSIKSNIHNVISEDIRIISTLKLIFEKYLSVNEEFDVMFFSNHRVLKLLTPIEYHSFAYLRATLSKFFDEINFEKSKGFIDGMHPRDIYRFIESLQELNDSLLEKLMTNKEVYFFHKLRISIPVQRASNFYFLSLIDIYDPKLLKSLSESILPHYPELQLKEVEDLIFRLFEEKIQLIMKL